MDGKNILIAKPQQFEIANFDVLRLDLVFKVNVSNHLLTHLV